MGDVSHGDVEVVRAVYAAMAERDLDRLLELIDPTCVITQDPALPCGGRYVGHDGFVNFGHTRGTVRASGATLDIPEVHRWTIKEGKAVAAHFAIDTAAMLDASSR